MPGFILGIGNEDLENNVNKPAQVVYTYTWEINQIVGDDTSDASQTVHLKETTLPDYTVVKEEYQGTTKYKYAKSIEWQDIKITFYDTSGLKDKLKAWRDAVWTADGGIKMSGGKDKNMVPIGYKRDSVITTYYQDDATIANQWGLSGSWVAAVNWSALTYTSSDVHNVSVTLSYDYAEQIQ